MLSTFVSDPWGMYCGWLSKPTSLDELSTQGVSSSCELISQLNSLESASLTGLEQSYCRDGGVDGVESSTSELL